MYIPVQSAEEAAESPAAVPPSVPVPVAVGVGRPLIHPLANRPMFGGNSTDVMRSPLESSATHCCRHRHDDNQRDDKLGVDLKCGNVWEWLL